MDFEVEDRIDKEMDMDNEYDMVPMPMHMQGGVPGAMPLEMMETTPGYMGAPGFMPIIMAPNPNAMPNMAPNMALNMMPNMMGMEQMMPGNMAGMNMMESEDDYYESDEDMARRKEYGPKEINRILMRIEKYNPGIFRYLRMYGVPYPVAKKIIRRIIRVTLMYYED